MLAKKVPGALATLGASSVDLIRVRDEGTLEERVRANRQNATVTVSPAL